MTDSKNRVLLILKYLTVILNSISILIGLLGITFLTCRINSDNFKWNWIVEYVMDFLNFNYYLFFIKTVMFTLVYIYGLVSVYYLNKILLLINLALMILIALTRISVFIYAIIDYFNRNKELWNLDIFKDYAAIAIFYFSLWNLVLFMYEILVSSLDIALIVFVTNNLKKKVNEELNSDEITLQIELNQIKETTK